MGFPCRPLVKALRKESERVGIPKIVLEGPPGLRNTGAFMSQHASTGVRPRPRGFKRLASRLAFWTLLVIAAFQIPLLLYGAATTRKALAQTIEANGRSLVALAIERISAPRRSIETSTAGFAAGIGPSETHENIKAFVRSNPNIFGATVARETKRLAPYYFRAEDDALGFADLADEDYDYRTKAWYRVPVDTGGPFWSEPYFDAGGGESLMTTFSVPLRSGDAITGVATADLSLDQLESIVGTLDVGESGYCFIVSGTGRLLYHPGGGHRADQTLANLAAVHGDDDLAKAADTLAKTGPSDAIGIVPYAQSIVNGRRGFLVLQKDPSSGWGIGVFLDRGELLAEMTRVRWTRSVLTTLGLASLLLTVVAVGTRVTQPLRALALETERIAKGDLDGDAPDIRTGDEVGRLTQSFERMRLDLKRHIEELTRTTAAKQRIETELGVARQIQMSLVPGGGRGEAAGNGYRLAARLLPARAVGGDWYDFFPVDDTRILMVVGDVSDKGVPAALLMSKAITAIHSAARERPDPAAILREANRDFVRDNEACMFATVFCALLDLVSGTVACASAGHTPPALRGSGGTQAICAEIPRGLPLGVAESAEFPVTEIEIESGGSLTLYSDGIPEAFDGNDEPEPFGEARLLEAVSGAPEDANSIAEAVLASVRQHVGDAQQSDDITLLVLQIPRPASSLA